MQEKSLQERYGPEALGERLAWARTQQGMTLEDVHARTGLAVGYICQLEGGSKVNPTLNALLALCKALCVPVSFLLGEVSEPGGADAGVGAIAQAFAVHIRSLPKDRQAAIRLMSVEQRFAMVILFVCERFPNRFSRSAIAFQIGMTVRALNDVLEQSWALKPFNLVQFCQLTGIGLPFFLNGDLQDACAELTSQELMGYGSAIRLAVQRHMEPAKLESLIRERAE
ncbi:MAG: transcriptional regulator [Firmicutes bacterium]|nr:transcriptional regulator [Bacillota bacterium]